MDTCLAFAPLVALVISVCKRIPFIGRNPKTVAAVLAAMVAVAPFITSGGVPLPGTELFTDVVGCILATWTGSIASYEAGIKPLARKLTGHA